MKLFKKAKKGFTLVELVVVIAVIAILAAVSVGAYFGVTESANKSRLEQEARQTYEGIRLISLADPENNQSLDIDGLHVRNNESGIPTFTNDLIYTTGINYVVDDEIPMVDGKPTITDRTVVLKTDVYIESALNSTAFNTYKSFDYYSNEVGKYYANVNIINGKIQILEDDFTTDSPGDEEPEVIALGSLSYEGTLSKSTYFEGEEFSETGLTFYANYSNGTKVDVTDKVTFENRTLELGTTSVTASYIENNVTKTVSVTGFTVAKIVFKELVVEGTALDTNYFEGESFNLEGLTFYEKNNKGDVDRENPIPHSALTISPAELTYLTTSVTISYTKDGTTDTYTVNVNVQKVIPTTLTVSGALTKNEYFVGEKVNLQGLKFSVEFNNDTRKEDVTNEVRLVSDTVVEGTNIFTAYYEYNGGRAECEVTGVTGIAIIAKTLSYQGTLAKNAYIDGDPIDLSGLTFTVTKNNGDTYTVENLENITSEPLTTGQTEVEVTYNANGIEVSCTVSGFTVEAIKVIGLSCSGTLAKTEYFENEDFDPTGLTFTATYNKGNPETVTPTFTGFEVGEAVQIVAHYQEDGNEVTCNVNTTIKVKAIQVKALRVSDIQKTYFENVNVDSVKEGRTFEVQYNNSEDWKPVEENLITVTGNTTSGNQVITFSYTENTISVSTTKTINFVAITLNEALVVSGSLSKTAYVDGEKLDLSGITFTATYNDENKNEDVTSKIIAPTLKESDTSATVTYTNEYGTATYEFTGLTVNGTPTDEPEIYMEKTYVFADYDQGEQYAKGETHELDENLVLTVNGGHFREEMRIYKDTNIVLEFSENVMIKSFGFNDTTNSGNLSIYGINVNGEDKLIETIAMSGGSYNTSDNVAYSLYSSFKFFADAQIRIKSLTVVGTNLIGGTSIIEDIDDGTLGWRLVTNIDQLGKNDKVLFACPEFNVISSNSFTDSLEFSGIDNQYFSRTRKTINGPVDNINSLILTVGGYKDSITLTNDENLYFASSVLKDMEFTQEETTWSITFDGNYAKVFNGSNYFGFNSQNGVFTTYGSSSYSSSSQIKYVSLYKWCNDFNITDENKLESNIVTPPTGDEITVVQTSFSSTSGNVNNDSNIFYQAEKGTASTAPAVNSEQIRVYQNGGLFTITAKNGRKLKTVILGSAMKTTLDYQIDSLGVISGNSLVADGKLTVNNINGTSIKFTCRGTDKNSRLYVNYIQVVYY